MGLGTHQQLLESKVIFDLPPKDAVIELGNIKRVVLVNNVEIIDDAAIVNGYLHMSIVYNTVNKKDLKNNKDNSSNKEKNEKNDQNEQNEQNEQDGQNENSNASSKNDTQDRYANYRSYYVGWKQSASSRDQNDNKKNKDKKSDRSSKKQGDSKDNKSQKNEQIVVDGVVRQSNLWIPFESIIFVPGATKGDSFQVVSSNVETEAIAQTMIYGDENDDESENVSDTILAPFNMSLIKGFYERDLIKIEINVC